MNNTNNLESFTKADSRLLSEIPVGRKKVTVVTAQPEDSYQLVTGGEKDKIVTKLLITDPVRFWAVQYLWGAAIIAAPRFLYVRLCCGSFPVRVCGCFSRDGLFCVERQYLAV